VAKAVNAIAGAQASTMATNFNASPLTTTEVDDPAYNLGLLQDVILNTHGRLALEIASATDENGVGNHPWRSFFAATTSSLANGAALPATASNGDTIVGAFGKVYVAGDNNVMAPAAAERVSMWRRDASNTTVFKTQPYLYNISGGKIYHTTGNVVMDCCTYERADYATTMAANGDIGLPDILSDALVAGSVASLVIEDEYAATAAYYKNFYEGAIAAIRAGRTEATGFLAR
jgi:hypothetical protein